MKDNKTTKDKATNTIKIIVKSVANGTQSLSEVLIPVIFQDLKKIRTLDGKKGIV